MGNQYSAWCRLSASSALSLLLPLSACINGLGTVHYTQNDEIPGGTREEIHALNNTIVGSLLSLDPAIAHGLFLDEVKTRPGFSDQISQVFLQLGQDLSGSDIRVCHEFDVTFSKTGSGKLSLVSDINDGFFIHTNAVRERMFLSLLEAEGAFEDRLIGLWYVHDGESWRLYDLRVGLYRVAGRSALEWMEEAQQLLDQGLAMSAQLRSTVARSIGRPLPYMQYVKEDTMVKLGKAISRDMAALPQLPLQLNELPTTPTVYAISPTFVDGRLAAVVQYVSKLERSRDTLAPEVEAISAQLSEVLPGLCAASETVVYRAFAEAPTDPKEQYAYFGVVYDCNTDAVAAL